MRQHQLFGRGEDDVAKSSLSLLLCYFLIAAIVVGGGPTLSGATTIVDCGSIASNGTTYFNAVDPSDSFTLEGCQLQGATVIFVTSPDGGALDIALHNVTLDGSGGIQITPETMGLPLANVAIRISGCRIAAYDRAIALSTVAESIGIETHAENISVLVEDSTITANSSTLDALVVSVDASTASYITLHAIRSTLMAVSTNVGDQLVGNAFALAVIAIQSDHINLHCTASSVVASSGGLQVVSAMGLASRSPHSIIAASVIILAHSSNVSATGSFTVSAMGISNTQNSGSRIIASKVNISAWYSSVHATGGRSVASMGFSCSTNYQCHISFTDSCISAVYCNVSAVGSGHSVASMGGSTYGAEAQGSLTVSAATNVVITSAYSSVYAAASGHSVSAMGLCSFTNSGYPLRTSDCHATNVTISATASNISADGRNCVAAMGVSSFTDRSTSSTSATDCSLSATLCDVFAVGVNSVAAMGITSAVGKTSSSSYSSATNVNISAAHSRISSVATQSSVAAMALTTCALTAVSAGSFSSATNFSVSAAHCDVSAVGVSSVEVMGIRSLGALGSTTNTLSGAVSFLCCGCSLYSSGSLFGVYPPLTVSSSGDVRWVVLRSDLHSDGDGCLNFVPQGADPSVLRSVDIRCAVLGTGYSVTNDLFVAPYGSNVSLNGQHLNAAGINGTFPFMVSDPSSGPFQEDNDKTSCPAIFDVPSFDYELPHGDAITTASRTRWISSSGSLSVSQPLLSSSPTEQHSSDSVSQPLLSSSASELNPFTTSSTGALHFNTHTGEHLSMTLSSVSHSRFIDVVTHSQHLAAGTTQSATISALPDTQRSGSHSGDPSVSTLGEILSPKAANVVVATGAVSTVVSGALTPTAATQYARVGAVLRSVLCILSEDEDVPSHIEHPLLFPVGSGKMPRYTGACLTTVVIVVVFSLTQLVIFMTTEKEAAMGSVMTRSFVKIICITAPLILAYFLPNISSAASILIFSGRARGVEIGVAIAAVLVWFLVVAWPLWATVHLESYVKWGFADPKRWRRKRRKKKNGAAQGEKDFRYDTLDEKSLFAETYSKYFDDTRDPDSKWCRLLYFEEVISTSLCAFLSGIRPTGGNCVYVLSAIFAISALHALYVIGLRPFNRKLGNLFSCASALLTVAIALIGLFVLKDNQEMLQYLAYPLFIQNVFFLLQAACEGWWAYVVASKRKVMNIQSAAEGAMLGDEDSDAGGDEGTEMPERRSNPLHTDPTA